MSCFAQLCSVRWPATSANSLSAKSPSLGTDEFGIVLAQLMLLLSEFSEVCS